MSRYREEELIITIPILVQALSSHLRCVSPNFRSETTFSKVAGGGARTANLQTRRLALNPLLRQGTHHPRIYRPSYGTASWPVSMQNDSNISKLCKEGL